MLRALDAARAETEGALARQRQFVADASHELRTPLTSVFANLELLEARLEGEDEEIAQSALRSSRRMRRLVADLLLLARADAGRATSRAPVDLADVAHDAAAEVAPLAGEHDLRLETEAGHMVHASADDLHRLVLNLLENAVMHTPAGTAVRVAVRGDGEWAVVEVEDDGPGVSAAMRQRIFERFVRGEGHVGGGSGSGLGLSIVQAVAQSHGGTVEAAEAAGGGARFAVRLPATRTERELPAHAQPAARASPAAQS
jgi:two-component system, OmpR family, sensor kinase